MTSQLPGTDQVYFMIVCSYLPINIASVTYANVVGGLLG